MSIEIHIDELILRGVPPEQAPTVRAALEGRLAELGELSRPGTALGLPTFRAQTVDATSPAHLGAQVADAVWSAAGGGAR